MPRGGKREGAGRKPGAVAKADREARQKARETGETPLEYMLRVMRDEKADADRRDRMAVAAGPFVHAKLAAVTMDGKIDVGVFERISRARNRAGS